MAKDPLDRQAGVYALGKRILDNKVFQAQTPENKESILRQYYKTYVEAAYESSNLQPPDENTWVKGMSIPGGPTMRVDDFYMNRVNTDAMTDFHAGFMSLGAGFVRTAANIIRGPVIAGMKVDTKMLGLAPYFNNTVPDKFMAAENVPGLVEKGNLPIWNRPVVKNDDGTHSSEYSTSFEEDGKEVLVPTVVNGKFLTPDGKKPKEGSEEEKEMFRAARGHYLATGEHLGKFSDYRAADAYSEILHNRGTKPDPDSWKASYVKLLNKMSNSGIMKASQDTISNVDFWFACRPTQAFTEKAGSFIGEQLAQLPLYQSIGLVGKVGLKAAGAGKLLEASSTTGALGRTGNLTRRLATSPLGRQVGLHLSQAAEGYVGGVIQGEGNSEAKMDAISFAALGIIGADAGTVFGQFGSKRAENAAKKLFAQQAAVGGLPLVQANIEQAVHDLDHRVVGTDPAGNPIVAPPDASPANVQTNLDVSRAADPVNHGQKTATKGIFIKTARDMYGSESQWNKLSKAQKDEVRAKVEMLATAAPQEIPVSVSGVQAHEIKEAAKKNAEMSPEVMKTLKDIEQQFGIKWEEAVADAEKKGVLSDTGSVTSQGTAQNITDSHEAVQRAKPPGKRPGPRTREDEVFSDYSDFGIHKHTQQGNEFHLQFVSKADRALFNIDKHPNFDTVEKLKQFFPDKTLDELHGMANEVKSSVTNNVRARMRDKKYQIGEMKYGKKIRIPAIHGSSQKEQAEAMKEEVEDFAQTTQSAKQNNPDVYQAGLTALSQMQALKMAEEASK